MNEKKPVKRDEYVVFTFNNARIVIGPTDEERRSWEGAHIVVKNPDLSLVTGFSPQYWKVENKKIVPLTYAERVARSEHIVEFGVVNDFMPYIEQSVWKKSKAIFKVHRLHMFLTFLGIFLGFFLNEMVRHL